VEAATVPAELAPHATTAAMTAIRSPIRIGRKGSARVDSPRC
jgi:hypothetical protein